MLVILETCFFAWRKPTFHYSKLDKPRLAIASKCFAELSALAIDNFQLAIVEGDRFLPEVPPVNPTSLLKDTLTETLPWAIAVSSEKARSEGIINPVLLEVKRQLKGQISVFSGEEFNVQPEVDLTGYVDFLISRSPEQLFIKAPAVVLVEAKKEDLKPGLGQCLAEMVAS